MSIELATTRQRTQAILRLVADASAASTAAEPTRRPWRTFSLGMPMRDGPS